ncbi:MAG: hypothetical protein ACRDGU_00985 [Actinomycetota bacterium]
MIELLADEPDFVKGITVTVAAFVLFVGSVYMMMTAVFGLRMAYLVLAVSFFGWMIIFSMLWAFGQPPILGVTGLLVNQGPRGTEPHWKVFAAGTGPERTQYPQTATYPGPPWRRGDSSTQTAVDTVTAEVQNYLAALAHEQLGEQGEELEPTAFAVQDVYFTRAGDGTPLAGARAFFSAGGPEVTVFAAHDSGNVPIYSFAFLGASILGFLIHLPFLDRAEKRRKAILTGGTTPPWYGPA